MGAIRYIREIIYRVSKMSEWRKLAGSVRKRGIMGTASVVKLRLSTQETWGYQRFVRYMENSVVTAADATIIGEDDDYKCLISIVMPVYRVKPEYLRLAVDSVLRQSYPNIELCICNDFPADEEIASLLASYQLRDKRVKVVCSAGSTGISNASNLAIGLATGDYVGFLDHDDELDPRAIEMVVRKIQEAPYDVIYTDEDKIDSRGRRSDPFCKPDWSPDLLYSHNYITHFCLYRADFLKRVGGLRSDFDGSQDYDLILRASALTDKIGHVRYIAYHWRMIEGSVALASNAKPYAYERGRRALEEHLSHNRVSASVEQAGIDGYYRVTYNLSSEPKVSIIICTRDRQDLLHQCVNSILTRTDYKNYELIVVDNGSRDYMTLNYLQCLSDKGIAVVRDDGQFNHSRLNNVGAAHASGDVLVFLNNDIEVTTRDWLKELVSHATRPGVGCVGAKLLYPNGRIQHSGIAVGLGGAAAHPHRGFPNSSPGYFGSLISVRNYLAVTGACLAVQKHIFSEAGGFDQIDFPVTYNDVDFCIRVFELGYRNLVTPHAQLIHHESASRDPRVTKWEMDMLRAKWSKYIIDDPYYSPFLTLDKEDFSFDSSRAVAHLTGGTLRSFNNVDHGVEVKLAELLKSENIHSEEALGAIFELWCTYHTRRDLRVVFNLLESHSTVGLLTWAIEDDAKRSLGTGRSSYSKGLEVIHDKVVKSIFFDEELSRVLA